MARLSAPELLRRKSAGAPLVMVTAYDAAMARLVDNAGVDMVLVGDSVGMVFQGQPDTLKVTMEDMIYHGRCVDRGLERAHLTVDMPFMSYQLGWQQALQNAGRLVKEGSAQSVKLEGGVRSAEAIRAIVEAGIPVVAHVGMTPQSIHSFGGFKVQGREEAAAERLMADAQAVCDAGAFAVVLEMVPAPLAAKVTAALPIPTIGIGAGVDCDGQVLVINDLLGMDLRFQPRFLKRYATLEDEIQAAVAAYAEDVRQRAFPGPEHSYHAK